MLLSLKDINLFSLSLKKFMFGINKKLNKKKFFKNSLLLFIIIQNIALYTLYGYYKKNTKSTQKSKA